MSTPPVLTGQLFQGSTDTSVNVPANATIDLSMIASGVQAGDVAIAQGAFPFGIVVGQVACSQNRIQVRLANVTASSIDVSNIPYSVLTSRQTPYPRVGVCSFQGDGVNPHFTVPLETPEADDGYTVTYSFTADDAEDVWGTVSVPLISKEPDSFTLEFEQPPGKISWQVNYVITR